MARFLVFDTGGHSPAHPKRAIYINPEYVQFIAPAYDADRCSLHMLPGGTEEVIHVNISAEDAAKRLATAAF